MADATDKYQPRHHDPERPAIVMCGSGETVTFGELESRANQGAHLLRQAGISVGDHIAIIMENRREFLEICFAADRAGVYYTAIATHLAFDEIAYIIDNCDAKLLIASDAFASLAEDLARASPDLAVYRVGSAASSPGGGKDWARMLAELPEAPIADEQQGNDMLYSSGTTGRPKGVKWPLPGTRPGEWSFLIELLSSLFGVDETTRYLSPAPLYHAAPMRWTMVILRLGGTVFIMEKFDALEALRMIELHRINSSQWVPTMFVRMLKLPEADRQRFDLSSMRTAVHAAAPCPEDIKRHMIDWWGKVIFEYYSSTETNGFHAINCEEWLAHPGSVGRAVFATAHICGEDGDELPAGSEGEIYFEGGQEFSYHKDPDKTAAARNSEGWTTVGDIGRLDEDGYLYLTDRKSFMIITGGVNVYPQESEDILVTHPAVLDAAVIGVPNEDFGEEVKAVVQLVDAGQASASLETELIEYCRARLSAVKCPRSVDFTDALPRSATGKLYKVALRKQYEKTGK